MQKISELLNITVTVGNPLTIYHPIFKDKEIYWEDSNGFWYKQEYNSNGNRIYFECSNGYWSKYEFDHNNRNIIYIENSNGDWEKREYDSNGNRIYFECSDGTIRDNRVTELTLEQIAEKFNISVNQLKIKK